MTTNKVTNSYEYDTFDTHVDSVELDGGVEVGPKMGHPHFHVLLTLTHFTYLQFDYYTMKIFLEIMFKGLRTHHGFPTEFRLGTTEQDDVCVILIDGCKRHGSSTIRSSS